MKRNVNSISDPAHGWLSVPLGDLVLLGIVDKISRFSFITDRRAYLEEDCDAALYINAAEDAGWDVTMTSRNGNANSYAACRSYASYNPYFARNPFVDGSRASYSGCNGKRKGNKLVMDDGRIFTLRKANPLLGLCEPVES